MVQGIQYGWIKSTRELWAEAMELAESSVRLDPRSAYAFPILSYMHAHEAAITRRPGKPRRGRSSSIPMTWARAASSACAISSIGEHREAIELFSTAVQRGNTDPRYQWAALNAFSHYLLRTV